MGNIACSSAAGRLNAHTAANVAVPAPPPRDRQGWLRASWVYQRSDASCSVASVTTLVNTMLAQRGRPSLDQNAILASDPAGTWARQVADHVGPGVTLDQLASLVGPACAAAGTPVQVQTVHITDEVSARRALQATLQNGESDPSDYFVICNFVQSMLTPQGDPVGHMSVVGGYDAARDQVLILDVDATRIPPYWVTMGQLIRAMHTADDETGAPRGYLVLRPAAQ